MKLRTQSKNAEKLLKKYKQKQKNNIDLTIEEINELNYIIEYVYTPINDFVKSAYFQKQQQNNKTISFIRGLLK